MPGTPSPRVPAPTDDLLLRETNHRCSNDLQLVVSLLALQSRRAASADVRQALTDAMERVSVLARSRGAMHRERHQSLEGALRQVCEALNAHAEPRGIMVSLHCGDEIHGLSSNQITTLALVVNELATNAIKHAFEERKEGHIRVTIGRNGARDLTIVVDDDGLPFPELENGHEGLGLGLTKRLMASIGGLLIMPSSGTKLFELRLSLEND